jgi:hypothetical protein
VEQWENEERMETILPQKINYYRIRREMQKIDTQFQTPKQNKDKLCQGTQ